MRNEYKEPTISTLRSKLKEILMYKFPENNFELKIFTNNKLNEVWIFLYGCNISENDKEHIEGFISYMIFQIRRKKTVKDNNKIVVHKYPYAGYKLFIEEDCRKYTWQLI